SGGRGEGLGAAPRGSCLILPRVSSAGRARRGRAHRGRPAAGPRPGPSRRTSSPRAGVSSPGRLGSEEAGVRLPLRGAAGERARDVLAGRAPVVPARDAATVVLLRDDPLETFLLRRKQTLAFTTGAYGFPGGAVDPRDADHAIAWAGPSPAEWAEVLRTDERTARGLVCAAVRETFEESGVLLAGPDTGSVVADTSGDDWEADRRALVDRTLSFAEFLERRRLVLRSDLLKAWAHWITPEVEPRRYDTRFFVAALPAGQRTRDVGGESDGVVWMEPKTALARAAAGEMH